LYVKSAKSKQSGTVLYPFIPPKKQAYLSRGSEAPRWLEMDLLIGLWSHIAATIVPHPYAAMSPLRVCAPYLHVLETKVWMLGDAHPNHAKTGGLGTTE
jgi:hypothetical protein